MADVFHVYAIRFAHRDASVRSEHFYGHDPCATDPWPISYYVWLAVSDSRAVLVDAGFTPKTAARRGNRNYLQSPTDTIRALGVDRDDISHLVLSHLHYDHSGHLADFPRAEIVLQESELSFWTSRHAGRDQLAHFVEPADVARLVEQNFAGRVRLVNGTHNVVPGVTAHHVGGHTPGLQVVQVRTAAGDVVLAADASHFYENVEQEKPYGVVTYLPAMYDAFDALHRLSSRPELIVPGHDPQVLHRFPAVPGLDGLAVRIA
ncbi:N-acyl homoserine lactonase family protein [Saccharopolyspora sp. HNM0983]|uniref:N-acyl homoserine lactonase family protein n=1 Tax=Saccharopolyspora montiporae TaxID=2781240 RepID=A0A929B492_9PSEU|nr:N-acyl homoserine lactonase family protein [Saccharopolyspora sp. HNM0983]MBE9372887.1 N-acyl homoserine lactonase family protein [Saccharopolyspora sp. HNM0983]